MELFGLDKNRRTQLGAHDFLIQPSQDMARNVVIDEYMYSITLDHQNRRIRADLTGFMTPDEVMRFSADQQGALADAGWASGTFDLLMVTDGGIVQSQETVAAFQSLIVNSPIKSRRLATVRSNPLARMQTTRIVKMRENAAMFESLEDAIEWLEAE